MFCTCSKLSRCIRSGEISNGIGSVFELHSDCFLNILTAFKQHSIHFDLIRGELKWDLGIVLHYHWPRSLHQLIKHIRLHPEVVEGKTVGLLLWAPSSVWCNVMIQPPPLLCQPRLGLIFSGSSPSLSFLGLFTSLSSRSCWRRASWSKATSSSGSILNNGWLMKMLNSAAFYTRSGNIPAIFLIHL